MKKIYIYGSIDDCMNAKSKPKVYPTIFGL